jgi:hypothetical protein
MQTKIAAPTTVETTRPAASTKKLGRPRTGEMHWMSCAAPLGKCHHASGSDVHWHARVKLGNGRRPFVPLTRESPTRTKRQRRRAL